MFTQRLSLTQQDARVVSPTALHKLGSVAEDAQGRCFRYAQAGGVNLAGGLVTVSPAKVNNHTNIAVLAAAVGARQVSVTVGNTAVTTGQYDGGFLTVNDGPGVGLAYRIAGTPTISANGTGVIALDEQVVVALTAASKVTLTPNVWSGQLVHPGGSSAFVCGGDTDVPVAAGSFYWSQTAGMTSTLSDGVIPKGSGAVLTSAAVPGAVTVEAATAVTQRVATAVEATVDAKYYPVFLTLE